jgi:hypothetical protein
MEREVLAAASPVGWPPAPTKYHRLAFRNSLHQVGIIHPPEKGLKNRISQKQAVAPL